MSSSACLAFHKWASLLLPYSVQQLYEVIELFPSEIARHAKMELEKNKYKTSHLIRWPSFFPCLSDDHLTQFFPSRTKADALVLCTVAEFLSAETSDIPDDPNLLLVERVLQNCY